jgi:hypothetical protein
MRQCQVHLENIPGSGYSQSRAHFTPMLDREDHESYDIRTWREHCTTNKEGIVCIPSQGLKKALDTAAARLGVKVPGRKGATYTKFFISGVMCDSNAPIANGKPLTPKDAELVTIFSDAGGKSGKGGGTRVLRRYPVFEKWQAIAEWTVIDDIVSEGIFETALKAAGVLVGIGRFRPEVGGNNGRFRCTEFEWKNFQL